MRVQQPVEVLYLALMKRWQGTAPADGHLGSLDGVSMRNSQAARLAYILQKIAAGQIQRAFSTLEHYTQRGDGLSPVSKLEQKMRNPFPLWDGWYLEGNMSMEDKRELIIRNLRHLGLSPPFISAAEAFVEGKPIDEYFPTEEEEQLLLATIAERERNR